MTSFHDNLDVKAHAPGDRPTGQLRMCGSRRARVAGLIVAGLTLLALAGCPGDDQPGSSPSSDDDDHVVTASWLTDVTGDWGIQFTYRTGAQGKLRMPESMAGGVALFDYDNDDDLDIYLVNGQDDPDQALTGSNRLYRQDSPGRFTDVTDESGLGDPHYGMGCAVGDIDNDGDLDVYVTNFGPDQLYLNNGDGTFSNVTERAGIDVPRWSASAAFSDFDRDGYLDLFVTRYVQFDPQIKCTDNSGRPEYCGPTAYLGEPDVLLHNNGDGTFLDVTEQAGIDANADLSSRTGPIISGSSFAGLGVVCEDFNGDNWIDIYVANDGYSNHLWINQHDGTFRNDAMKLGVAMNKHGQAEAGMGVIASDLDNDLDLDLMVTHLANETNTLYRNGGIAFQDDTDSLGLSAPSLGFTGFGIVSFDIELDGDLDLAIANGRVTRLRPTADSCAPLPWQDYSEPNQLFINTGGAKMEESANAPDFSTLAEMSRGLAAGDLDNDGDIDLVVNNTECPTRIFRNDSPRAGHWLVLRVLDPNVNRDAIGATVTVAAGDGRWFRTVNPASSYVSSNDPRVHFGIGTHETIDWIDVRWPDGSMERFAGRPADQSIVLQKGDGVVSPNSS